MTHKTKTSISLAVAMGTLALAATSANAAVTILGDDFADVVKAGNTATFTAWDTVNGIDTPASSLAFLQGGTATDANFFNVTAGEIDVNNNMTAGGWDTSFTFDLDGSTASIDLTEMVIDLRLTTGSGADQNTGAKSGQMLVELEGSTSGVLGTADLGGNIAYPTDVYQRTVDLSGFATLDGSETYTITLQARGTGFGHHKSLQAFTLNGDITAIPEPSTTALLGLGGLALILRRRR